MQRSIEAIIRKNLEDNLSTKSYYFLIIYLRGRVVFSLRARIAYELLRGVTCTICLHVLQHTSTSTVPVDRSSSPTLRDGLKLMYTCPFGRAVPARHGHARHGSTVPRHGTARPRAVPCRASTPCRLSYPGTTRLSLDGPCRAWGTVSPAVPCRARAQDTQELNQLQIMQYKQISYVQTQAFNNS